MIPVAELNAMRSVAEAAVLPDLCTVRRPGTPVLDDAGSVTSTTADAAVGVPCQYRPATGDERQIAGRQGREATAVVLLPAGTDVRTSDQLVVTVVERNETHTLEVLPPVGARSYEILRRVYCAETG